jgi:hypothetical protein
MSKKGFAAIRLILAFAFVVLLAGSGAAVNVNARSLTASKPKTTRKVSETPRARKH